MNSQKESSSPGVLQNNTDTVGAISVVWNSWNALFICKGLTYSYQQNKLSKRQATYPSGKSSQLFVFWSKTFQVAFVSLTTYLCEGQTLLLEHFWRLKLADRTRFESKHIYGRCLLLLVRTMSKPCLSAKYTKKHNFPTVTKSSLMYLWSNQEH